MFKLKQTVIALGLLTAGVCAGGWQASRNVPGPEVPFHFIQSTAPVAVSIQYRPLISKPLEYVAQLSGVATYKFTNLTNEPVSLSFPPARVFGFTVGQLGPDDVPAFMAEKRIVTIPAGQAVQFDDDQSMTLSGEGALKKFLQGGPGWSGFVFEKPVEPGDGVNYCSGTLFASYSVEFEGQSQADREKQQGDDAHRLNLLSRGYQVVVSRKKSLATDRQ